MILARDGLPERFFCFFVCSAYLDGKVANNSKFLVVHEHMTRILRKNAAKNWWVGERFFCFFVCSAYLDGKVTKNSKFLAVHEHMTRISRKKIWVGGVRDIERMFSSILSMENLHLRWVTEKLGFEK